MYVTSAYVPYTRNVKMYTVVYIPCPENCFKLPYTVEPPNKGHFGNGHFVLFSEAVPYLGGLPLFDYIASFNDV